MVSSSKTPQKLSNLDKHRSGKKFPSEPFLDELGERIISGELDYFTFNLKVKNPQTVHFFAHHEDSMAFLNPDAELFENKLAEGEAPSDYVNLGNYDDALDVGLHGARFLISGDDLTAQWDILEAALNLSPRLNRKPEPDSNHNDFGTEVIREQAELAVNEVITNIHDDNAHRPRRKRFWNWLTGRKPRTEFDAVFDYGYAVTHVFVRDFLGLRLSSSRSWLFRPFALFMRLFKKNTLKRAGLSGAANECYFWILIMFGNLFVNPGGSIAPLAWASRVVGKLYKRDLLKSFENPHKGSLIDRLKRVEALALKNPEAVFGDGKVPAEYLENPEAFFQEKIVNIIMEVAGSFQFLTGTAFNKMLLSMEKWHVDQQDGDFDSDQIIFDFVKDLNAHPRPMIDECLRHNSPTQFMFRKAHKDFQVKKYPGLTMNEGDLICLITKQSMLDYSGFSCEQQDHACPHMSKKFLGPKEAKKFEGNYLTFGSPDIAAPAGYDRQRPHLPHHPCFGQYWGRIILQTMFNGLTQFKNVRLAEPEKFNVPAKQFDSYKLAYDLPVDSHSFVTILTEFDASKDISDPLADPTETSKQKISPETLLGLTPGHWRHSDNEGNGSNGDNPSNVQDFHDQLANCPSLHYMSAHVVRGVESEEPDYLLLELSLDGDLDGSIDDLTAHFGEEFLGLYKKLGVLPDNAELAHVRQRLLDDATELHQASWPGLTAQNTTNGLPFCGSPGLSTQRILAEAQISDQILEQVKSFSENKDKLTNVEKLRTLRSNLFAKKHIPLSDGPMPENRWVFGGSKPPNFADSRTDAWNSTEKKSLGALIGIGLRIVPKVLLVPTGLIFLLVLVAVENIFGNPPDMKTAADMALFPPNSFSSAQIVSSNPFEGITISAGMAWIFAALSIFFGFLLSSILRRTPVLGKSRTGHFTVIGLVFACAFLWAASHRLWIDPGKALVENWDTGQNIWYLAIGLPLIVTAFVYLRDDTSKWYRKSQIRAKAFSLFSALTLVMTAALIHLKIFKFGLSNDGFSVSNRFLTANMFDLVFYPLVWAVMITVAVWTFRSSYAKQQPPLMSKINTMVFALSFAFIFTCSFFPVSPDMSTKINYLGVFLDKLKIFLISAAFAIPAIVAPAYVLFRVLRRSEKRNTPNDSAPNAEAVRAIMDLENGTQNAGKTQVQNHMISVQQLLPSWTRRRIFVPLSFQAIKGMLGSGIIRPGFLGNVGTVHYARWVHLPKTSNFVFLSNFDGSWESYLEDFIAKVWQGVNAAWSHCKGFPEANSIFLKGVDDGDRFKKWARGSMRPTPFWYAAYPELSLDAIRRNTLIRDGLVRARSADEIEAWFALFGSSTRLDHALQTDQIQNIAFGGSPHLPSGSCIILEIDTSVDHDILEIQNAFCDFVHNIKGQISFGQGTPREQAIYLALGYAGLKALDKRDILMPDRAWAGDKPVPEYLNPDSFAMPFKIGMHDKTRKTMLGDPADMEWGTDGNMLAAIIVHTMDDDRYTDITSKFESYVAAIPKGIKRTVIPFQLGEDEKKNGKKTGKKLFQHREPFGFTDGVSNPVLKGTRAAQSQQDSIHLVEPGEFILGYKDNRGYYPPSPQVPTGEDPARLLPALPQDQLLQFPRFDNADLGHLRDLGRNGSYMVIRQLEQNVKAFNKATNDIAKSLAGTGSKKDRIKNIQNIVQAKLIGRWHDGSSLVNRPANLHDVRNPRIDLPDTDPDRLDDPILRQKNEFLFGRDDPQGVACPFGSHIRRANPRDSLDPNGPDELTVANRHRILRRGRTYGIQNKTEGTLFICLNADLDRQFEFVQQTWMLGPNFHGLKDEYDPIANRTSKGFTVQCPMHNYSIGSSDAEGEEVLEAVVSLPKAPGTLQQFVTLRGGGYFFLPGKAALDYLCYLGDRG